MIQYLLDSGPLAALLQRREPAVEYFAVWLEQEELATSILIYGEIIEYIATRPDRARHELDLRRLMFSVPPLAVSYGIMEHYAQLRLRMRRPYGDGLIGDLDTLIAASALVRNLTIVTMDRHFMRVPDLGVILLSNDGFAIIDQRAPAV